MSAPSDDIGKRAAACPICRKPAAPGLEPFCSRRCADLDLGRWLKGGYAIPGAAADEAPDTVPTPSEPSEEE